MKNFKSPHSKLSHLGTTLLILTLLTGCGAGGELDWASHQDPTREDQLDVDDILPEGDEEVAQTPPPTTQPPSPPAPPAAPDPRTIFHTDGNYFSLAHNKALRWEGCHASSVARGGYLSDTACGRAFLYDKFVTHLNRNFFTCVEKAAQSANLSQPSRVFINHMGSYNDRAARGSTRLSMHAYARALDLKNINLIDSRGNVYRISTHVNDFKGATATFYDSFRSCWMKTMPSNCKAGQTEYQGSIGHVKSTVSGKNSLHNDHIHLSYPTCAGA